MNGSAWREQLIARLEIDYFNPVVPTWTEEDYVRELHEREICDVCLYVLTPLAEGFYSVAEVVDDSNKRPEKTMFCFLEEDEGRRFSAHQLRSLEKTAVLVRENGGQVLRDLEEVARALNGMR